MGRSWNDLFTDPRFHWKEPDPGVVAAAARWARQGRRVVYDLGCGAGRHMAYLQAAGSLREFGRWRDLWMLEAVCVPNEPMPSR
jgi:SAM-dependent methyltransferase